MKVLKALLKLAAAAAAIAGIAYLVVKNIDTITNWLQNLCPNCKCTCQPEIVETAAEEEAVEDTPVEEPACTEEADPIPEDEPVAEDCDFEE